MKEIFMQHTIKQSFSSPQDVSEDSRGSRKAVEKSRGKGQWEVIKCCGKDASFPSRSASITNCQELGKCISKKSVSSCLIHLIISLNVFYCSLLETGCCSGGFWSRELVTSEATASFLVKSYLQPGTKLYITFPCPDPSTRF